MQTVQPPLEFIPPAFDPWVWRCTKTILPLWLRWHHGLHPISVEGGEQAAQLYHQFQTGQIRLILAFRHPTTEDPLCLTHVLAHHVPQLARQQGIPLSDQVHAHFVYDRGVPLWAGSLAQWGLPRLGATPICRGKRDQQGLRTVRDLLVNGRFPLALAPEGTINGHNHILNPLEPGTAQMGFWCVEDLRKAGRDLQVMILPIGVQYHYVQDPWPRLSQLLDQLERECGLSDPERHSAFPDPISTAQHRVLRIGERVISMLEGFYHQFYHPLLPQASLQPAGPGTRLTQADLVERIGRLLDTALQVAEIHFGLHAKADLVERRHQVEQAGWQRIYREDLPQRQALSPLERGLADRIAHEAHLHLWHMQWMETFVATAGCPVDHRSSVEWLAEISLRLWNGISRLRGRAPMAQPPSLGSRWAQIRFGDPLWVSEREQEYRADRRGSVARLTQDLQHSLQKLISD